LSIGGVSAGGQDLRPDRLIAGADAALYRAKGAGLNRGDITKLGEGTPSSIAASRGVDGRNIEGSGTRIRG
jgi:GGDEF domain-containing protein